MKVSSVILASGTGESMHSSFPTVLHLLAGRPMITYALDSVGAISADPTVVVMAPGVDRICQVLDGQAQCVLQGQPLGSANALRSAEALLAGKTDLILVTLAAMPLITAASLSALVALQRSNSGPLSMLTLWGDQASGCGRVIRRADGSILAVDSESQFEPGAPAGSERCAGVFCFKADWLWNALRQLPQSPSAETSLNDLVALAAAEGTTIQSLVLQDASEVLVIQNRVHLAQAEGVLRSRINTSLMLAGVTMIDPSSVYIEAGVQIGADTILWPDTYLRGKTVIGVGCSIGPNTMIQDCKIGDHCTILASVMEKATLEDHVNMGPYARLRKGAHLASGVHMGNFGEVKNSYLGPGTKMGHFSYLGDATIGQEVNIGAGTITCNFDGEHKYPTSIGNGAFIGSDTMLVAPLRIGENARTGAGAVVTHDVADGETVVGVPARVFRKHKDTNEKPQEEPHGS
jgi:bifunctional UDP-N-acetylglucosamine pyrophosphorylase/glucosamine-1-phosphate N-acetyltransferase